MKKKKVEDLTEEEIDELCDKHPLCKDCPLLGSDDWCYLLDGVWGDLEIEIGDNNGQ